MTYESLVYDENQLVNFYNTFFSEALPFHTDFFCLAARKKYMTEEQKKAINLGDTCMMNKTILKEYNVKKFLSKVYQADASASFLTDRDGNYIPRSCVVFYMNINRTNVLKATKEFKDLLNVWDYDIASCYMNSNPKENLGKQLKTIQNNLLKSFQGPKNAEGDWIDIDCDLGPVDEMTLLKYKNLIASRLQAQDVHVIQTHGGCHILISKKAISEYNRGVSERLTGQKTEVLKKLIMTSEKLLLYVRGLLKFDFSDEDVKEVKFNQNAAVPLPGTLQGGFPVKMI